jgi:programmed cell death 6-interacting protein
MLSVPEKKTAAAELFRDRHFFNSAFFTDLRDARAAISATAANPQTQPPASRRALLLRYHRLLFSARDDPCAFDETLAFTWHDAFKPHLKHASASLRFEKAALVFNLGAVASRIAAAVDRTAEGRVKEACAEFQRAAGAFRAVGAMMEGQGDATVDMSPQAAGMLERLMLAQAQECCFERALAGGTSAAACSKVTRQVRLAALCCLCCPVAMRCDRYNSQFCNFEYPYEAIYYLKMKNVLIECCCESISISNTQLMRNNINIRMHSK